MSVEKIVYENQGEGITGYLGTPAGPGPHPAVIVIPAIAGINEYIKDVVVQLNKDGFVGLAIDFYTREGQAPDVSTPAKVGEALAKLPDRRVLSDVTAAAQYLKGRDDVKKDGIGVLGFCVGGTYAYLSACETDEIKAAVDFYGLIKYGQTSENKPASPIDRVSELKAPLLAHYGESDRLISARDIADFKAVLDENQKAYEVFTYAGAPHAFHEHFRAQVYRPVAAHLAWQRSMRFLGWYLAGRR